MLALSPLRNSTSEAKEGLSDAFLTDDFLDTIDFSSIFDVSSDLFPNELLNTLAQKDETVAQSTKKLDEVIKRSHGKKKVKVDWTPELHRRFVQAVEELGVDKAVPSRILEIMGIQNLTRHNVASHLQKYRSHRKHLLAREAEAASWSQRRQIYGNRKSINNTNKENNKSAWIAPTITGFIPPPQIHPQLMRPILHVWGHPTLDRPPIMLQSTWPQTHPCRPPPHPTNYVAYCQPHYQRGAAEGWGPSAVLSAPHFMPHPFPVIRFAPPPVAGVPPHPMHWVSPILIKHSNLQPELHDYPSKESIDAAIGDVLAKPWLPLPLGLKPPSTESVLVELQRQGISKVPPACNIEGN